VITETKTIKAEIKPVETTESKQLTIKEEIKKKNRQKKISPRIQYHKNIST